MSPISGLNDVVAFVSERFPVDKLNFHSMIEKKEVPIHKMTWGYYTGGLALLFLFVQVVTGLFLLFYYQPTVSDANLSVEYITKYVSCGALIRNMHAWSSSLMIFFTVVHLLTTFAMKAFDRPREITWVAGVCLLLITYGFGFTGYLLPWNQIAVNATKVGLQSVELIGTYLPGAIADLPRILKETFQGEASVGQATLGRFYAMHVVLLPLALFAVLGIHLLQVQLHGMSQGIDRAAQKSEKFFPLFILRDLSVWGVAFLILFVLALCLPFDSFVSFPLLEPYNALGATPPGIKPEWYFYFIYYPLELLPFWLILLLSNLLVAGLFLTPWIFRDTSRTTLGFLALLGTLYLIIMTIFGHNIYEIFKGGG
jgi:cytochrome b6